MSTMPAVQRGADYRAQVYRRVRNHLDSGATSLPPNLADDDVLELANEARMRHDYRVIALCEQWW
jgi:hypothetical protein